MPAATVLSSVSTVGLDTGERLAFWEQHNAEALVGLTCSTYEPEGLLARQLNLGLGAVRVADIAGNPHVIERAPGLVRSRPKDALFVSLLLEGEAFFYHSGGCLRLGAGDVVVYPTDRPYLFGFSQPMRQVLLDLPLGLVEQRCAVQAPRLIAGGGPGAEGATARALREVLLGFVADPAVSGDSVGDQLLDLVETMTAGRGTPLGTARVLAAKTYIAEHLQEPDLCAESVGRALGVTARHLNRAFAAEGSTVTRTIQSRRLDRARQELAAPGGSRVGDIASRWGFASQAHFTRLFRAAHGCTPTEFRARRRAAS